jgi:hypothetical protein
VFGERIHDEEESGSILRRGVDVQSTGSIGSADGLDSATRQGVDYVGDSERRGEGEGV